MGFYLCIRVHGPIPSCSKGVSYTLWKGSLERALPFPSIQDLQTTKAGPVLERAQNLGTKTMHFCGKEEIRFCAPLLHELAQEETWQELLNYCVCDPIGYSPPGSSVHGIFQARVLEWGAIAFSKLVH